jgi:hypothetical protein
VEGVTVEILELTEAQPETYPETPMQVLSLANSMDLRAVWARLEAYCAHRWTPREVVWIVEGPGCFEPTLAPAEVTAVEVWSGDAWSAVTLAPSPRGGHVLPGVGPYRFTTTVGADNLPPPEVEAAFVRLAEYLSVNLATSTPVPVLEQSVGDVRQSWPEWRPGKALQLSGAADLLRPYRRA